MRLFRIFAAEVVVVPDERVHVRDRGLGSRSNQQGAKGRQEKECSRDER
jgi:hypothetical protein